MYNDLTSNEQITRGQLNKSDYNETLGMTISVKLT